jgi:hypothetical protein
MMLGSARLIRPSRCIWRIMVRIFQKSLSAQHTFTYRLHKNHIVNRRHRRPAYVNRRVGCSPRHNLNARRRFCSPPRVPLPPTPPGAAPKKPLRSALWNLSGYNGAIGQLGLMQVNYGLSLSCSYCTFMVAVLC